MKLTFGARSIKIFNDSNETLFYDLHYLKGSSIEPHSSALLTFSQIAILTFTIVFYRNQGLTVSYRRSCGLKEDAPQEVHVKFENNDIIILQ
ncbi:MAG: hypothetical protein NC037_00555 [Bacteroides sp.]|nr:hypothetical protein [Bacillota bacterium]MCM1393573.1 hypothetical protein [[Eubacterium] siraeum]MCM1455008.1 hypothetical protein [Bacteroides sp.]